MPKCPVVSILNMKGGVGKTTLAAHVFRVLYHRHSIKTLLIDLDAQFNLTQCIVTEKEYEKLVAASKTVMSAFEPPNSEDFFQVNKSTEPPPPIENMIQVLRSFKGDGPTLDLLPGSFDLVKYSLIDNHEQLQAALNYFKIVISNARDKYGLIVIDCNPSSSFITRCSLEVSTHLISPVRPDKYSILGIRLVEQLLQHLNLDPDRMIVMNGVARGKTAGTVESDLRSDKIFGGRVLVNRLMNSGLLRADQGYTGFATDKPVAYRDLLKSEVTKLVDELVGKLSLKP